MAIQIYPQEALKVAFNAIAKATPQNTQDLGVVVQGLGDLYAQQVLSNVRLNKFLSTSSGLRQSIMGEYAWVAEICQVVAEGNAYLCHTKGEQTFSHMEGGSDGAEDFMRYFVRAVNAGQVIKTALSILEHQRAIEVGIIKPRLTKNNEVDEILKEWTNLLNHGAYTLETTPRELVEYVIGRHRLIYPNETATLREAAHLAELIPPNKF